MNERYILNITDLRLDQGINIIIPEGNDREAIAKSEEILKTLAKTGVYKKAWLYFLIEGQFEKVAWFSMRTIELEPEIKTFGR